MAKNAAANNQCLATMATEMCCLREMLALGMQIKIIKLFYRSRAGAEGGGHWNSPSSQKIETLIVKML